MRLYPLLLTICCACMGQDTKTIALSGTATNMTNPDSPLASPMVITLVGKNCSVTISPPLAGSGQCLLKTLDQKSGKIEIASAGNGVNIIWTGMVRGNVVSGTYTIEGETQTGTFYLAIVKQTETAATKPTQPTRRPPATLQSSGCSPAIESAISGEVKGWDGETIFKLDNGQIWQQAAYGYTYFYAYHPEVTIYQTRNGCRMKVEDEDDTIIVKRIN